MSKIDSLEQALIVQHNTVKKLVNETLALRAFSQTVLQQQSIDIEKLRDDYVDLWQQAIQQLPVAMQDTNQLQILLTEIERELNHRNKQN